MSAETVVRTLPPDVYDALELSALVYGGIGQPQVFDDTPDECPVCMYGHAAAIVGEIDVFELGSLATSIRGILNDADLWGHVSDAAVGRINKRRSAPSGKRVSFAEWAAELGVVRGGAA